VHGQLAEMACLWPKAELKEELSMKRGKFIVLEGIDGAGCTTEAIKMKDYIDSKLKLPVHLTKEPTDGPVGGLMSVNTGKTCRHSILRWGFPEFRAP